VFSEVSEFLEPYFMKFLNRLPLFPPAAAGRGLRGG